MPDQPSPDLDAIIRTVATLTRDSLWQLHAHVENALRDYGDSPHGNLERITVDASVQATPGMSEAHAQTEARAAHPVIEMRDASTQHGGTAAGRPVPGDPQPQPTNPVPAWGAGHPLGADTLQKLSDSRWPWYPARLEERIQAAYQEQQTTGVAVPAHWLDIRRELTEVDFAGLIASKKKSWNFWIKDLRIGVRMKPRNSDMAISDDFPAGQQLVKTVLAFSGERGEGTLCTPGNPRSRGMR